VRTCLVATILIAHLALAPARARAPTLGTNQPGFVTGGTGTTGGGTVALVGLERGFRAATFVAADGSFAIDDVPAGDYELILEAADGIAGGTSVTVPEDPATEMVPADIDAAPMGTIEEPYMPSSSNEPTFSTTMPSWPPRDSPPTLFLSTLLLTSGHLERPAKWPDGKALFDEGWGSARTHARQGRPGLRKAFKCHYMLQLGEPPVY
jgi:hypothetical protein